MLFERYPNVIDLVDSTFSKFTEIPAYSCMGHTLTFTEVNELSLRFASYLQHELKLQPGDRVALQLPNILQFPVAMYGVIRAGLVIVNVNPLYTAREIKHQLVDSGAKALVVLSNVANCAAEIVDETDVKTVIVTNFADLHPAPKRQIMNFVVKYVKKMVPNFHFKNQIPFRDILKRAPKALNKVTVEDDTLAILQYTGGTTGVSKGAMLSHKNITSNVGQMIEHIPSAFGEAKETFLTCLPLYHIYALNLHGLAAFCKGEHNVLVPNARDLQLVVDGFKNYPISVFIGINTLYVALCHNEQMKTLDYSNLKISTAGGMALTEDAAQAWESLSGCEVCEGYGLTETSPVVTGNRPGELRRGTIGVPIVGTEVCVVDDNNMPLPNGEAGELCVKGPQVMLGYWNRPEETAKVLDDEGWFKTGDIAVILDDGFVKIVDRKKDMILVSGFNVYPNEIEDVVTQHPKIIEAAAVGFKSDKTGEAVRLFVVVEDELSEQEIMDYCREHLTAYKNPKEIVYRDTLPKTNVGKILRRELRDNYKESA